MLVSVVYRYPCLLRFCPSSSFGFFVGFLFEEVIITSESSPASATALLFSMVGLGLTFPAKVYYAVRLPPMDGTLASGSTAPRFGCWILLALTLFVRDTRLPLAGLYDLSWSVSVASMSAPKFVVDTGL